MDFLEEVMLPVFVIGALIGAVCVAIFGLVAGIDYLDCRGFQKGTGIETRWEWGCYAKVDAQWVPKDYAFGKAQELRIKDKR